MTKHPKEIRGKDKKSRVPLYVSLAIIGTMVLCYFLIPPFKQFCNEAFDVLTSGNRQRTSEWVQQFGFWGPFVVIVGQVVQMFLFVVPTVLLMIVSILAYGPWMGSVYAMIGIVLASATAYIIGNSASEPFLNKLLGKKTREKFVVYVERYGAWLVVVARINPVLSNDTISFISGIVRLSFWKFMLATIVATTPLLILISYLGENEQRLKNGMIWISIIGLALVVVYVIYREVLKRRQKKKAVKDNEI